MLSLLTDIFFPRTSLTGTDGEWLTEKERSDIERSMTPLLLHQQLLRKSHIMHIDAIVAATTYGVSPLLKKVIHHYKYKRIKELHSALATWIQHAIPGHLLPPEPYIYPVLCPVPLHWSRHFFRGFNQSSLLSAALASSLTWKSEELLVRTRATGHQAHRDREERLQALKGAFLWNTAYKDVPPWVVLVDDVCTTGTTLDECAKVLKSAGVKHVSGLVVAYG